MAGVWIPVTVYLCRQYSVWDKTALLAERAWATVCGLSERCMGVFTSALLEPCRSDVITLEPEIGSEITRTKRKLSVWLRSSSSNQKKKKRERETTKTLNKLRGKSIWNIFLIRSHWIQRGDAGLSHSHFATMIVNL